MKANSVWLLTAMTRRARVSPRKHGATAIAANARQRSAAKLDVRLGAQRSFCAPGDAIAQLFAIELATPFA